MTAPYARIGFPRETNLAELYHENTKIRPYMRDHEQDPAGVQLDLPPPASLSYADPDARIPLPAPAPLLLSLEDALRTRRTRRDFNGQALGLGEVSAILAHTYGPTGEPGPDGVQGRAV